MLFLYRAIENLCAIVILTCMPDNEHITHTMQYTCYTIHMLCNTHAIQYTYYTIHILCNTHTIQYTYYTKHMLYNTHAMQYTYYTIHILFMCICPQYSTVYLYGHEQNQKMNFFKLFLILLKYILLVQK